MFPFAKTMVRCSKFCFKDLFKKKHTVYVWYQAYCDHQLNSWILVCEIHYYFLYSTKWFVYKLNIVMISWTLIKMPRKCCVQFTALYIDSNVKSLTQSYQLTWYIARVTRFLSAEHRTDCSAHIKSDYFICMCFSTRVTWWHSG